MLNKQVKLINKSEICDQVNAGLVPLLVDVEKAYRNIIESWWKLLLQNIIGFVVSKTKTVSSTKSVTGLRVARAFMLILWGIIATNIPADAYQITITANGTYSLSSFIYTGSSGGNFDTVLVVKETTTSNGIDVVAPIPSTNDSIIFEIMPSGHTQAGTDPVTVFLFKRRKQELMLVGIV